MKKKSIVWRFYNRLEKNGRAYAVVCELCNTQYKYFGNTSNLRSHLKWKHPIQWELLTTGTLDEATCKSFQEPGNDEESDQDVTNEDQESAIHIQNMPKDSDEEWLEDPFEVVETQPKRKRINNVRIKRETESPVNTTPQTKRRKYVPNNFNKTYENPIIISNAKDEYTVFGEYVSNKVRKFTKAQTRGNVQQLITTILWQAEYGLYDNPEAIKQVLLMSLETNSQASMNVSDDNVVLSENVVQEIQVHSGNLEVHEAQD